MIELKENERIDDLDRNGYRLIQNPKMFCFGIDAVLLSDFTKVKKNEKMIDFGTGNGILPILLECKTNGRSFIGIDIQPENIDMARRSAMLNGIEEKVFFEEADIKTASKRFEKNSFDVVVSNPPYMISDHGLKNDYDAKTIARHEVMCNLDDIIREGGQLLKQNGRFYMIHRPFRLVEILATMTKYQLEPKQLRFIHPYVDKEPSMVMIEAIKGAKPMVRVLEPLIIYKETGIYTDEIYKIYRE